MQYELSVSLFCSEGWIFAMHHLYSIIRGQHAATVMFEHTPLWHFWLVVWDDIDLMGIFAGYLLLVLVWVGAVVTVSVAMIVDVVKQTVVAVLTFGLMARLVWRCFSLTASCSVMPIKYFTVLWCLYDEHICALALGISSNSYPCMSAQFGSLCEKAVW